MQTETNLALLKLMYLVSPALPVGAYAYSAGQEYAVDAGWLITEDELGDWVSGVMAHSLGKTDAPVLARLYTAWAENDFERVCYWNDFLRANRETKELQLEDEQLGLAMVRILETHGITAHQGVLDAAPSFATLFALAAQSWNISKRDTVYGLLWSWLENQVAAATKSVPLGQTAAQRILMRLIPQIPQICDQALILSDDDIGGGLPGLALASSLHERQYSRLFRS